MRNIGSTNNLTTTRIPKYGQYIFRGPTGPAGDTGPSITGGFTGNTGNTGHGVYFVAVNLPDGLTIYVNNNTAFDVSGVSGNAPTDTESYSRAVAYTFPPLNPLYTLQGVNPVGITLQTLPSSTIGFTLMFSNYYGLGGISLYYSGDDLVFHGLTSITILGITGAILAAAGNTAIGMINSNGIPVFRYQQNTVGITTEHVVSGVLNQFIQAVSTTGITNINLTNVSGITAFVGNPNNISTNFFYLSGNTWTNKQYYNTTYSGVTTNNGSTSGYITHDIFNISNTTTFGKRKIGSCCYCDSAGEKRCLDYVSENYCINVLNGNFLFSSCVDRRGIDCDDWGACCLPTGCIDTTRALCSRFGGSFHDDALCSQSPSPCI
jgi:hypothetical protein